MTVTLGIDSSTRSCGVAIYEDGEFRETKLLEFDGKFDETKLAKICYEFDQLFEELSPDMVILEEPVIVRGRRTYMALNQTAGAIFGLASKYCDVLMIHNRRVKKLMGLKTKQDSIDKAKEIYKVKVNDDEADAIMIVEAYMKMINA